MRKWIRSRGESLGKVTQRGDTVEVDAGDTRLDSKQDGRKDSNPGQGNGMTTATISMGGAGARQS